MWGDLAAAIDRATTAPAPDPLLHTRDLAQIMDTHIAWTEQGRPGRPLALPAMFAVVRLIASTIDQLPIVTGTGGPAPDWLRRPRKYGGALDQGDLIHHVVVGMAERGQAYLLVTRSGESWRLDALHHGSVGVQVSSFGAVDLKFTVDGEPVRRVPVEQAEWRHGASYLLHIPYLVTPDAPQGTSPAVAAADALHGYLAAERQAANLLDSGTWSGGILSTDQDITADSAARWQQSWVEARRAGRIPVLGAGLTYSNDAIDPVKAQYMESRLFAASQTAQMFGVPPDMLGMALAGGASSLSYSNSSDNLRRLRLNCLEHFTTQIGDALSTLMPNGRGYAEEQTVGFDYTEWERGGDLAHTDAAPR